MELFWVLFYITAKRANCFARVGNWTPEHVRIAMSTARGRLDPSSADEGVGTKSRRSPQTVSNITEFGWLDIIAEISAVCRDFCVLGATNGFDLPATNGVNSTAKSVPNREAKK